MGSVPSAVALCQKEVFRALFMCILLVASAETKMGLANVKSWCYLDRQHIMQHILSQQFHFNMVNET